MKKIEIELTPRQVMVLRALLSYGYYNIDDINETLSDERGKIVVDKVAFAELEERDFQRLSDIIQLMDFEDD